MNMMRDRTEHRGLVAISAYKQKLIDWYNGLKVEMWKDPVPEYNNPDKKYSKFFKQGSELEWYNPIQDPTFEPNDYGHGIFEEWARMDDYLGARVLKI